MAGSKKAKGKHRLGASAAAASATPCRPLRAAH